MDNIVGNLQSKYSLTYVDIRSCLLELSGSSNLSAHGTPLNTSSYTVNKFYNKKKNSEKPYPTRPGKTAPPKCNQYSYCKKHHHPYKSHTYNSCNRIKCPRDDSFCSVPLPERARDIVPYRANLTVNEQYDHGIVMITASLPHPITNIASGSAFTSANVTKYEVCICNTGAAFHLTADFCHLLEPISCHVGRTVGRVACLHTIHMGSVELHMEIGGIVRSVTLSNVLYVYDCNGSLMHLVPCTRPDLAFSVSYLSRFPFHALERHHCVVKRIFRYLAGTLCMSLRYKHSPTEVPFSIVAFSDSDYPSWCDTSHSVSCYAFM